MDEKIFDSDFIKKLNKIGLSIKIPMNEGMSGGRRSKAKGSSVEFSDFREYTLGDDFRRVDWNAYGRFDKLFIKLYMEEREALINIFIDKSKSMNFGKGKKSVMALKIAAVFAYLSLNSMDRVCINSFNGYELEKSSSLAGNAMFSRCLEYLQKIEFNGETSIYRSIIKKDFKGRGISIIISDFLVEENISEIIKYLRYKNQQVILVHILSKEELKPELQGQIRLIDSETGEYKNLTASAALLKQYEKKVNMFIDGLKEECTKHGASYVQLCSEDTIEKIIFNDFRISGII